MKNKSFLSLTTFLFFAFLSAGLQGQKSDYDQLLPVDEQVKIGKLDNGFTYYIRANQKPEKRVELRLAVNAGSILEDDDQQGLAHFCEHMCFNGTKHFEKNELIEYLQSIGIRFGPDLNAYTSFDETVYMLTIPSDSTDLINKGFLVMEDWAHNVTFEEEEIDKERGVIIEEWRLGRGPWQRMRDEFLPVIFKDSRYAGRLPIGKKEIVENCDYETLRRFYRDWYRPDLMALIVVGDIDPALAEQKIKDHFSNLASPDGPKKRVEYPVPDHEGTLVCVATDPEVPVSLARVYYKSDTMSFKTKGDYLERLNYSFLTGMINRRLVELTEDENPPFVGANIQYGNLYARTKNALQGYAIVGEKGIESGMKAYLIEMERVRQHGFTGGEFSRYKLDLLRHYENAYNERDKTESEQWADEYIRNFLEDEPIPGIEFEYNFIKDNIDQINLEDINKLAATLITSDNRVLIVNAPEKEGVIIPDESTVLALAGEVGTMDIRPYEDKVSGSELIAELPEPGKIVEEKPLEGLEATEYKLSNGMRVIVKKTDFKNDEVLFSVFSQGGHSVYSDEDHFTALNTDGIVQESGVAEYSNTDIRKILAGKTVYVAPSISYETESIGGQTKTSDLESMFQLVYLYFTDPRADSGAFQSYITKRRDLYENLAKDPQNYFFDKYYRILAQDHPRGDYLPKPEDWGKVDFQRAMEIYKDRFADPSNFTFVLVGAFSADTVKNLLEKYMAALPGTDRDESFVDLGMRPPEGKQIHNIYKGNDPKSLAIVYFEEERKWNEKDAFMIGVLSDILGFRYIEKLREEMSGVYTSRVNASLNQIPYEHASLQIMLPCSPENVDSLVSVAIGELDSIQQNGVKEKDIIKAKETRRRQLETNVKTNKYWLSAIQNAILNKTDLSTVTNEEYIDQISSEEIQRVANKYFNADDYLQVVLYPEAYEHAQEGDKEN
ncbi:MAG: insulinase family protein [Bacteroidales bacterium]|jgi:zinc protease